MKYRKGFKYQLAEDYTIDTGIVSYYFNNDLVELYTTGRLLIKKGFAWDGASFIVMDTKSVMEASLVHDALYYLMRQGIISGGFKEDIDLLYYNLCIKNGCWKWRAKRHLEGLLLGGRSATLPKNKKRVIEV